jgi:hypothetical protein
MHINEFHTLSSSVAAKIIKRFSHIAKALLFKNVLWEKKQKHFK